MTDDGTANLPPPSERRWQLALLIGIPVLLVLVIAGAVFALRDDGDDDPGAATGATSSPIAVTVTPAAGAATNTATAPARSNTPGAVATNTGPGAAVPVYYLADVAGQLRLYREFRQLPATGGAARAALAEMLRGQPLDPDYVSLWPKTARVLNYSVSGDTATIDLSREALDGNSGAEGEARSIQQLVYTVTAADTAVRQVRLLVEGQPVSDLWGHGPVGQQPITRAPMLEVQGLIWIIDPAEGASSASPVTVRVFGTAFEGAITLRVFRGTALVTEKSVTTAMGEFREAATTFDLPAGTYTLRAYDENASNGTLIERDSKSFTVR